MVRLALFLSAVFAFCRAAPAQTHDYFRELELLSASGSDTALMHEVLEMPYDVMVDHLDASADWFNNAQAIALKHKDLRSVALSYLKLGTIEYLRGNYELSVSQNLNAITLFESLGMSKETGAALCELGYQMKRRDLNRAFKYFRRGLNLLEAANASQELCAAYDNFGVLFEFRNDLDSAGYFYQKALSMKQEMNDSIGIPYSLNNLGMLNVLSGKFDEAKPFFDQAFEIRRKRRDVFGQAENMSLYGDLFRGWKKFDQAVDWYRKSIELCDSLRYPKLKQDNLVKVSRSYEALGRFDLALYATRAADSIGQLLLNEKNSKAMMELEQKFQVAEKDRDIARLQSQTASRRLIIIVIISILVLVILTAVLYNLNLRRKQIAERNRAILIEREAGLRAVFDATEEERKRIARDLHDGIGQQLSGLRLSLGGMESGLSAVAPESAVRLQQLNNVLDDACKEVRSISHQMMPKALLERGLLSALDESLSKTLGLAEISYRLEHFQIENKRFDHRIELSVYRIAQELLSNIMRHSKATSVSVQLFCNANTLILIIEDNGKGFDPDKNAEGIGLLNIRSRMETVNGTLHWEKSPAGGMIATLRVPVNVIQ
jgi:signal transduction histidine kinase